MLKRTRKRRSTKPVERRPYKLTAPAKVFVCLRLAEFATVEEVALEVEQKFGIEVSHQAVHQLVTVPRKNGNKWEKLLAKFRVDFIKGTEKEPMANKRIRLQRLDKTYHRGMEWHKVPSPSGPVSKCVPGVSVKSLQAAREEIEGQRVTVTGSLDYRLQDWDQLPPEEQWKRFNQVLDDIESGNAQKN